MAGRDWAKTVNKLKEKLQEATSHDCEEGAVIKVLQRLVAVPMTLELLQLTHIGKEVNRLRKIEGEVGKTAKQLVKSWKQLLADVSSPREGGGRSCGDALAGEGVRQDGCGEREEGEREGEKSERGKGKHRAREEGNEGRERERRRRRHQTEPQSYTNSLPHEHHCVSPSTSVLAPPTSSSEHTSPVRQGGYGSSPTRQGMESSPAREEGYGISQRYEESSSGSWAMPPAGHRKRKAVLDKSTDAVAHTKRSRTQVYSGKKATSGPQVVMSLFDMSMKILIDNIDAIEEVGGVPYLILEPLLQKCTATQLLRLEEFNPHFVEDGDVLWERHCQRDFRGSRPHSQQTWRELYLSKLTEREERLKNITASIRKREEARKEPVRQVKLAVATRAPGRRRQVAMPLPSRPSLLNRSSHFRSLDSSNVSKLKKQTMKMVKERSMMAMSRPGKR